MIDQLGFGDVHVVGFLFGLGDIFIYLLGILSRIVL